MKAAILGATALALGTPAAAHAMGSYTSYDLIAWSEDGAAALLASNHSSSGAAGSSRTYLLVTADTKIPTEFAFTNTYDPDTAHEKITPAACTKAADALAAMLAKHRFKGVAIHKDRCKVAARDVVAADAAATAIVEASWVAKANARAATTREGTAWELAQREGHADDADVATTGGALVLVMWGQSGDSSGPKNGAVFGRGKRLGDL